MSKTDFHIKLILLTFVAVNLNSFQVDAFFERTITLSDESTLLKWEQSCKFLDSINWSKREGIELILEGIKNNSTFINKLSPNCESFLSQNFFPWTSLPVKKFYPNGKYSFRFNQLIEAWFTTGPKSSPLTGHTTDPGSPVDCLAVDGRHSLVQVSLPTPGSADYQRALVNNLTTSLRFDISSSKLLDKSPQFKYYADHIKYFFIGDLFFGVCTPKDCSTTDVNIFLEYVSNISGSKLRLNKYHQTKSGDAEIASYDKPFIKVLVYLVFAYFTFVIIASFIYDMIKNGMIPDYLNIGSKMLKNFSFAENKKILCQEYDKDHYQKMRPLDTVKFYFQLIASALHICIITPCLPVVLPSLKEWRELVHYSAFGNDIWLQFSWGIQLVFAISGFFSCYVVYPILQRTRGKLPLQFFILKRWLRTVPTLIAMIILTLILPVIMTSNDQGLRTSIDFLVEPCYNHPWQTIFLINNWNLPLNQICLFQSWFISSDFQLWLLAYIPLILLYKSPKIGVISCLVIMAGASVSTTLSLYHFDLPAFPVGHEVDILVSATHSNVMPFWYFTPHNNAFCYFAGILTAYYCLTRKKLLKQSNIKWIMSWTSFLIVGIAVNFFPAFYKHIFHGPESRILELSYGLIARASVASYAVILFVTLYNNFHKLPPLKWAMDILGWDSHVYTILGRLSFSVFLSHILIFFIFFHYFIDRGYVPVTFGPLFVVFLAYNFVCYLFGYFIYMFIEGPTASILSQFTSQFHIQEYELPKEEEEVRDEDEIEEVIKLNVEIVTANGANGGPITVGNNNNNGNSVML